MASDTQTLTATSSPRTSAVRTRSPCGYVIAVVMVLAAALLAPTAWAQDMIRIGSPNKTTTLDPMRSAAAGNILAFGQLYARLLRRDRHGKLVPGLAKSWVISDHGKVITLKLRNARFSNGSQITARDVVFSLTRVLKGKESAYAAPLQQMQDVRARGDTTVVVTLKHPFVPFLGNLEVFNTGIVSRADVEKRGEDAFSSHPVTSGPYMVGTWKPNDRLILKPNPYYWRKGYPKNDGAELIEVSDQNTRVSMMLSGELDAATAIPWSQVSIMKRRKDISIPLNPSRSVFVILLNEDKPPFDNIKIRQAAAHALNTAGIAKVMTFGNAPVANTTLPKAVLYHDDTYPGIKYDPEEAKRLLKEGGYNGKPVSVLIQPNPANKRLAVLVQALWSDVGIKANIETVDLGVWWKRILGGDYNAAPSWWYNETPDPDLAVRFALCGTCGDRAFYTNYNNPKVDKLIEQAAVATDKKTRARLYRQIQEITTRDVSQIPLYYPPYANAYSDRIKGLKMSPSLQWSLEDAVIVKNRVSP